MELSVLDTKKKANTGAFLHLKHPGTGDPLFDNGDQSKPVGLYIMGKDSDVFAKARHKSMNDALSGKKKSTRTSEQIDLDGIGLLADMTTGWQNLSLDGNSEFSRDTVAELYSRMAWVREQANLFIDDRANFI